MSKKEECKFDDPQPRVHNINVWTAVACFVLFCVSLVWLGTAIAAEVDPAAPAGSGIPSTAGRITKCVAIDDTGVAYCNVVYTWRVRVNRFCCTYQRDLAVAVSPGGGVAWIAPLAGKSDTRILSVSADGDKIVGYSMGYKATALAPTLWVHGVPQNVAGTVAHVSNTSYTVDGVAVSLADGSVVSPASCIVVVALNDVGGGLCYKDLVPEDDNLAVRGIARFNDPEGEDDEGRFIVTGINHAYLRGAAINNNGDAVLTVWFNGYFGYLAVTGQPVVILPGELINDINDAGIYAAWNWLSINAGGSLAGYAGRVGVVM
jgi:hypothetical protein